MNDGYALCLNKWALDEDIKNELGLLIIISSLTAEKGYCFASNNHLAKLFHTNETLISRKIKKLEAKGYINIEYERCGTQITSRKIRLSKTIMDGYRKRQSTVIENDKDNNTSINNNKLNEFNLYNNFDDNLQCDCIAKSTGARCTRKSSFNINGKNYCNQHARDLIPDLQIKERFKKPTLDEVRDYCLERHNNINPKKFIDFYEANNWTDSRGNKVKSWKQKVITWEGRQPKQEESNNIELPDWFDRDLNKEFEERNGG